MRKIACIIIVFLYSVTVNAQIQSSYYYKNDELPLTISTQHLYLTAANQDEMNEAIKNANIRISIVQERNERYPYKFYWAIVKMENNLSQLEYENAIRTFKREGKITAIEPVILGAVPTPVSNISYVKLKTLGDFSSLDEMARQLKFDIGPQDEYMPNWYMIRNSKNSMGNSLEVSKTLAESHLFEAVDPGFMFKFSSNCTSEPLYSSQWGINGSVTPFNINVCNAWQITKGSSSIKVAVLDQGIDGANSEFSGAIGATFDASTNTTPSSSIYGDHATHVAGIIGARENNNQIIGVAPNTGLMSINHPLLISATISSELARGMNWAWQNGADVISNSWGDQGGQFFAQMQSALLDNAISDAMTKGRGGLGTVVVFAAGNFNTVMDYPANSNADILTVGSIDQNGMRSSFSGHASQLDVTAPGGAILSTILSNNTGLKSGTSMAAPHVAGVAALMLAINPCLTRKQVHDVICRTAQKINSGTYSYTSSTSHPLGTWDNEQGYGLVDAGVAVDVSNTRYLQNTVETGTKNYLFRQIRAGDHVTNLVASGAYTVNPGASVTMKADLAILLEEGFYAEGVFEASILPSGSSCSSYSPPNFARQAMHSENTEPRSHLVQGNEGEVHVYPNPATNRLNIDFDIPEAGQVNISITNLYGQTVYTHVSENQKGHYTIDIPTIRDLASGVYILNFCIGEKCTIHKFIKAE